MYSNTEYFKLINSQEKLFQLTINKAFIFGKALYRFE